MDEIYLKILAAIAPAIVLAMIIIRKDKRPEPMKWLLIAAGLGALIVPAMLSLVLLGVPDISTDTYIGAFLASFITAAIPEEGLKFLALYFIARRCRYFDEMFDGVVYAVCIGMGFAGIENILYITGSEEWIFLSIARALMSVPMHYFFAVIMGAFFSLGWFDVCNRKRYMMAALVLPVIVHGAYDTLCFSAALDESVSVVVLLAFLLGFKYIRRYVRSLTRSMLNMDMA